MPTFAQTPLPSVQEIQQRLEWIFPEGLSDRQYLITKKAAQTIFAMLYVDAVEGTGHTLAPVHVYRMSDEQAKLQTDVDRDTYRQQIVARKYRALLTRWMADNSREIVRDEVLRGGLIPKGAAIEDRKIETTAGKARHSLKAGFARLFLVPETEFPAAAKSWTEAHLGAAELARVHLLNQGAAATGAEINIRLPNGEIRNLPYGKSEMLTKAVVEVFAKNFLKRPAVIWISTSRDKIIERDGKMMSAIGLPIDGSRLLPDLVLADLVAPMRLFFVEIVASDGPFTEDRRADVLKLTTAAGFPADRVEFISAFQHRGADPLKRRLSALAVNSHVWCMAEPDVLISINGAKNAPFHAQMYCNLRPADLLA